MNSHRNEVLGRFNISFSVDQANPEPVEHPIVQLQQEVITCTQCPRLIAHCQTVAREKRRAYQDWAYWGKPVPAWGDPYAQLLIIGLAPGAHGANRTGRMFTGDRSGDFLYRALWEAGFASQPYSTDAKDGLTLQNAWITASARCAPPDNRPFPEELSRCAPFLEEEFRLLANLRLVVALGGIAANSYLRLLQKRGEVEALARFPFGHGRLHSFPQAPPLLCCYHPSQQNTSTGRLTAAMLRDLFIQAASMLSSGRFPHPE